MNPIIEAYIRELAKDEADFQQMADLEEEYFPPSVSQSAHHLKDDFNKQGFEGISIYDDENNIVGYIYGYSLKESFEYDYISDLDLNDIQILKKKYIHILSDSNTIRKYFNNQNSFYVANFLIHKPYRFHARRILLQFFDNLKNQGVKYLFFSATQDTEKLINFKLPKFGIAEIIAKLETGYIYPTYLIRLR